MRGLSDVRIHMFGDAEAWVVGGLDLTGQETMYVPVPDQSRDVVGRNLVLEEGLTCPSTMVYNPELRMRPTGALVSLSQCT